MKPRNLILLILLILYLELFFTHSVTTFSIQNYRLHNSFCQIAPRIHQSLINLYSWNPAKHYRVLELGAGSGLSTQRFQTYLNQRQISYDYTICEYDETYEEKLNKIPGALHIGRWQDLPKEKYDVILMTVFSTVTPQNAPILRQLMTPSSKLLVVCNNWKDHQFKAKGFHLTNSQRKSFALSVVELEVSKN